jgi:hypothetical protein
MERTCCPQSTPSCTSAKRTPRVGPAVQRTSPHFNCVTQVGYPCLPRSPDNLTRQTYAIGFASFRAATATASIANHVRLRDAASTHTPRYKAKFDLLCMTIHLWVCCYIMERQQNPFTGKRILSYAKCRISRLSELCLFVVWDYTASYLRACLW